MGNQVPEQVSHTPPGAPAWVKWLGIGVAVAVVLLVVVMLVVGGDHGPGRHGG